MKKKITKNFLIITLDKKIYPLEAIYGACYVFVDRAYLFLKTAGVQKIEITFKSKEKTSYRALEALAGEFSNELLNFVLRINLSKENKKIRQYVVERALFSAVNVEKSGDEAGLADIGYSSEEDPLGIAVPWEEKYGRQDKETKKEKIKKS